MSRVAIATCTGNEHDPDSPVLMAALAQGGIDAQLAIWDDEDVNWDQFDLVVIRSTWDYVGQRAKFLRWASTIEHLLNPYGVIAYSTDKHYLADLQAHGLRVVPSTFVDVGTTPTFPDGDFVVKPCVGAGSMDAERYEKGEIERASAHVAALHAIGRDALIQPYVTSVDTKGERALIFINGAFSHAMTKQAMLNVRPEIRDGLYRLEAMSRAEPEPDALAFGQRIMEAKGFDRLLYGRVDLVGTEEGWAVMELELVEPSLFLTYDDAAAHKLVTAIGERL